VLEPGATQVWELKYVFSPSFGVGYAADVEYKILGTEAGTVAYNIYTFTRFNKSTCSVSVTLSSSFTCTAEGTKLTFKNR
jgi:hypothetical protein